MACDSACAKSVPTMHLPIVSALTMKPQVEAINPENAPSPPTDKKQLSGRYVWTVALWMV